MDISSYFNLQSFRGTYHHALADVFSLLLHFVVVSYASSLLHSASRAKSLYQQLLLAKSLLNKTWWFQKPFSSILLASIVVQCSRKEKRYGFVWTHSVDTILVFQAIWSGFTRCLAHLRCFACLSCFACIRRFACLRCFASLTWHAWVTSLHSLLSSLQVLGLRQVLSGSLKFICLLELLCLL